MNKFKIGDTIRVKPTNQILESINGVVTEIDQKDPAGMPYFCEMADGFGAWYNETELTEA